MAAKKRHNVRTQVTFSVDVSTKEQLNEIFDIERQTKETNKSQIVAEIIYQKYLTLNK